jgi:hypothetical protein
MVRYRPALMKDQSADAHSQRRGAEGHDAVVRIAVHVDLLA